ncbi:MAG: biosynthetic-type acetolactate synthase large subunit [Candidatus Altiarchaeales archaeon]|nr:biosynthetic-type acetolactate synthase large subunit [Candidatus Altiarchaeales archaeon]
MKGSEAIIKCLMKEKVKHMFGILGGSIMELYDVMHGVDESSMRHILMRHEQSAAHAAAGYARVSGEVGVCIATSGPGATNLVTGITDAHSDSVPLIALTGQVPTTLIGNDAFQEADIVGITMPVTKHNYQLTDARQIPRIFKEAFTIARTRRPGPVLIDIPKDVQVGQAAKFEYPRTLRMSGYKPNNPKVHKKQIKNAAHTILEAERPVVIAGGGVINSNASKELMKLVESLNLPTATTLMGKGAIPEEHPLSLGMLGMHGRKTANLTVNDADVIIAVGCRFSDRITGDPMHFSPESTIIHIDIDSAEIGKNIRADVPIVGDAREVLKTLLTTISHKKNKGKTEWNRKVEKYQKEFGLEWFDGCCPIKPQNVMKHLNNLIDDKTIVSTEVGQNQMFAAHYLKLKKPRQWISSGGLGTMGSGFPYAIGAKVAKKDNWVVDVAGEGSFLMSCQDLATCTIEDIPVTVTILRNNYLGMVKQWQDLFYEERRSHTYLGDKPDFVKLAESFSADGVKIEKPGEIKDALNGAKKSGNTTVIEVAVDPHEHILPMMRPGGRLNQQIERHHLSK